jgi:hypothetical protein
MVWRNTLCSMGLFAALLPSAPAQELLKDGKPQLPSQGLGPNLILWSQAQHPQPVPEPLPHSNVPKQRPTSPPADTKKPAEIAPAGCVCCCEHSRAISQSRPE